MKKKHKLFCEKYAELPNGAAAARYAGYSVEHARIRAYKLLKMPHIKQYIKELQDKLAEQTKTDAETHRKRLVRLINIAERQGDTANALKGMDQLSRMNGHYEKDNQQKQANITMELNFGK